MTEIEIEIEIDTVVEGRRCDWRWTPLVNETTLPGREARSDRI